MHELIISDGFSFFLYKFQFFVVLNNFFFFFGASTLQNLIASSSTFIWRLRDKLHNLLQCCTYAFGDKQIWTLHFAIGSLI